MVDPNIPTFINDLTADIWWLLVTFWTVSGAFSTLASHLPPPIIIPKDLTVGVGSGITGTRLYRAFYHIVNFVAQNVKFARNTADPTWRRGIEMTLKILGSLIASGAAGTEAQSALKKVADINAALDSENSSK